MLFFKHITYIFVIFWFLSNYCLGNDEAVPNTNGNWMAKIQADIATREYYPSLNEKGLQAPNRAHNLRFYFKQGVQVHDRSQADEPLLLGMGLAAYGRGEQQQTIQYAKPTHQGNEVSYQHSDLREWYRNSRKGLEQGFNLPTRPFTANAEFWLDIQLQGNVKAQQNGADIQLRTQSKRTLSFAQLHADDATGKRLPSRMVVVNDSRVRLWIDDRQAVYPIVIDPILGLGAMDAKTMLEFHQANAGFGYSVASVGDVNNDGYADVIVGATQYDNGQTNEGAAFVYHGSANGISTTPSATLESNLIEARFGTSVASAGDVNNDGYADVIVGAYSYNNGQSSEGAVFVYHGSASGLSTTSNTILESNHNGAYFGTSVASAGDINNDGYADVIVGAPGYNGRKGAAFVYQGSASGLSTTPSTTWESNNTNFYFGQSVASAGDVNNDSYADVIVGAYNYSTVFIYHGSASGLSTTPNTTWQSNGHLGYSVASAGDVNNDGYTDVIVGAKYYSNGQSREGAAFVYHGSASGISTTPSTTLESNQADAELGSSVASAGDVNNDGYADVIVGAWKYDNGQTDEGAAFVYQGSANGINTTPSTTLEYNQASSYFGRSIASAGDVNNDGYTDVIVGAGEAAFVYHGSANGLASSISTTPTTTWESNQASAVFGISVASAGDVNNDGYADVIVGASSYDNGQTNEGATFIYHGSANGFSATSSTTLESNQASSGFGGSVASAGDVNNDGYADVIVGAYHYDNGETDEGVAFVYQGSASGLSTTPSTLLESNQVSSMFGYHVASAGDVNNDGYADVIVGDFKYNNGSTVGAAFVYQGSAIGLNTIPSTILESNQADSYFGISVASAGDVNNDSYADVIVGAYWYDNGEYNEGAAFVYHGSASGLSTMPSTLLESNQSYSYFGTSVASAGDVNNDGYADVIVGADYYDNDQTDEGAAFVYQGSASGLSTTPSTILESNQAKIHFGRSVASAGDVNNDGYADVIVGAYAYDNRQTDEGAIFVYHGSASGLSTTPSTISESNLDGAYFGMRVASAGDVNNDGYADVIVGATSYDNGETDEGAAFVYMGSSLGINAPPTFVSTGITSIDKGSLYNYNIYFNDIDGDSLAVTSLTRPTWLSLIDNGDSTANLTGTPTITDIGDHNVTLRVTDGIGIVDQSFTITVNNVNNEGNDAPTFTSTEITSINEDSQYSYSITTIDPDVDDTLTLTAPTKPTWLTFTDNGSGNGTLMGTPTNDNVGNHNVILRVNDETVDVDQTFILAVININDVPVANDGNFATNEDTPLNNILSGSDIDTGDSLTYSIVDNPSNGTVSLISGTNGFRYEPSANFYGTDTFTYKVNDTTVDSNLATVTINVTAVNDAPIFTSNPTASVNEDTTYSYSIATSDSDGDTLTITVSTKPTWLNLTDNGNGTADLIGSPSDDDTGNHNVILELTDEIIATPIQQSFTITVKGVNDRPTFTASNPPTADENAGSQTIPGWVTDFSSGPTDEAGQTIVAYTVSNISNSSLFAVNPAISHTGTLTYTPAVNASGSSTFNVTVTDNGGTANGGQNTSVTQQFTIIINPLANAPSVTSTTTLEDTMTGDGLVISRHPDDGSEVNYFKMTNITGGKLYHNNGFTPINEGDFITFAQANVGLRFLPNENSFGQASFDIQAGTAPNDTALNGGTITAIITVDTVADTPLVTNAFTQEGTQTVDGLVITRHPGDGDEVTYFKITNIQFGQLYQNDGITEIKHGDFITIEEGKAGLKFTPSSIVNGNFNIQSSLTNDDNGLGGDIVTATINLSLINEPPELTLNCTPENQTTCALLYHNDTEIFVYTMEQPFGELVQLVATAVDTDAPAQNLRFSLEKAPAGANINPLTGEFAWMPTQPGDFSFTVTVTDDGTNPNNLTDREEITIIVTTAPILLPIGDQIAPINRDFSFTANAKHHNPFTFSLVNAPADATINPETGEFNWIPTQEGEVNLTVKVTESGGLTAEETILIKVVNNTPPEITLIEDQTVNLGELLSLTVKVTDLQNNALMYRLTKAPVGATIHPTTGALTWVPINTGTFSITVEVNELDGIPENLTSSQTFQILANTFPAFKPIGNQAVPINTPLSFTIKATHPNNHPLIFTLLEGPPGATLDKNTGEFNWTPTNIGIYRTTIQVMETIGELAVDATIAISVSDNTAPVIEPIEDQIAPLNRVVQFAVEVTDAQENSLLYSLEEGPEDATVHPLTGQLTWIPTEIGTYNFVVLVQEMDGDPINLEARETFELNVNTDPSFETIENQAVAMGNTLTFQAQAFHPLGNPSIFRINSAPSGATIHPQTGIFSWTPVEEGVYDVILEVADQTDPSFKDTENVTIIVKTVSTELALTLSSATILPSSPLGVFGNLYRSRETSASLKGLEIQLNIITPDVRTLTVTTQTLTNKGEYFFTNLPAFEQEGDYSLQAIFNGNRFFTDSESEVKTVLVRNLAGYAILVEGRTASGDGLESYNKTLNRIYLKMKNRGFQDEDIYYYNYDTNQETSGIMIDGLPSEPAIMTTLNELQNRMNAAPAPLYLVMVDHGGIDGSFYIDTGDGGKITPTELSRWLNKLENGLNEIALGYPRIIVIGACYSGTFLPALSKPGRIIITSAAADEESFKGPKEPDEIRSGEFFTEAFFAQLGKGKSVRTAFELATSTTEIFTRRGDKTTRVKNRFQDDAAQHPLLEDEGNQEGSNALSTGIGDGITGEEIYLGVGTASVSQTIEVDEEGNLVTVVLEDQPVEILSVSSTIYLNANTTSADLFATVNDETRVGQKGIIVDIRTPSMTLTSDGTEATGQKEIDLMRRFLAPSGQNRFSNSLDVFHEPGQYEIIYFVIDTITADISPFKRSVVYKDMAGNRPPKPLLLQTPENGSEPETTLIFSWKSTFDPDNDLFTYTLQIATEPEFKNVVYQFEELPLAMTYLDKHTPIDDPLNDGKPGLRDGTEYFWQVEAIDPFGARTISEVFSFTTNNTNAPPGIGSMHISSALDFSAIDNAEFLFLDEFGNPLPLEDIYQDQGYYQMLLPPGRRRAVIQVAGHQEKEIKLDPTSELAIMNIELEPIGGIQPSPGQLQLTTDKTTVNENQETISVLVKREGGRDGTVSVNYASENGTAIDGRDYFGTQGTLTWEEQDNLPKRITIALQNDSEPERDKTFKVMLYEPTTGGAILGPIQEILVTITDDDWQEIETSNSDHSAGEIVNNESSSQPYTGPNQLRFLSPNYIISEGGNNTKAFPVIRLGSTNQSVSVQYRINGGSATQGQDYTGGNGSLTWPAGNDLPKYLNLSIIEDDKPEENETIELSLFNPIGEIRLGEFTQATLTIRDNDGPVLPPTVQFSAENETAYEGEQEPITLTVTRTGTSIEGEVSVQYFATHDGTAIGNVDYQIDYKEELFGKLTWADGDSEPQPITLHLIDDKELENPETVHVKLFNASGEISLGTPAETTLTIIDNEHRLPTIPLSLGLGMGIANEGTLYRAIDLKNLFETSVIFWGGAKIKGQDFSTTLFPQPSQMVEILGEIHVEPKHVGKRADILVVASASDEVSEAASLFLMLDNREQVQVWDGELTTLVGIEENLVLPETQVIEIFHGFLAPVRLQIYFGYRLQEDGFIYFNGEQAIKVWVEPEHEYSLDDDNSILFADWSQDGQLLVTASTDSIVRLWALNTGSRLAELRGHTDTVKTAMFSPDSKQILTASADNTARLWEVETHQELLIFQGHTGEVTYATFSPNGQNVITASADKTARIWDAKTGDTLFILEGHEQGIQYATFSHDGKQVATASWDHTARLWNPETGEELAVLTGHDNMVEHVAFSPNDQYLVTTSWDKTAKLWDTHTGQEIFTLTGHRNGIAYAAFSPAGEYLLTISWDNSVRLWFVKTGEPVWVREHQAGVHHAAFSPDGHQIITGSNDGTARLWETVTGKPLKTLKGHQDNVWQVGFSPDGKRVISASWDNSVRVWDVDNGEVIMILKD